MKRKRNFVLMIGIFILFSVSDSVADAGDDSESTDLRDVVTALQVCAGMSPDVSVEAGEKVGLDDAILAIQIAANILKF